MVSEQRRFPQLGRDDAMTLFVASIVSDAHLACELERLSLSDAAESVADAMDLRPQILAEIERRHRAETEEGEEGDNG
jgi:hypothetical protein